MKPFTRKNAVYKKIVQSLFDNYKGKVTILEIEQTIRQYLISCKRMMIKGKKVPWHGLALLSLNYKQVKKMQVHTYRQRRIRYYNTKHFKKHQLKQKP